MKFHLILTLDYELFGNGSGCLQRCLIEPVSRIAHIVDKQRAVMSYFVDALEFDAMRNLHASGVGKLEAYPLVERQINHLAVAGNSNLQLHLHPQWLAASLGENGWVLDHSLWRIGSLGREALAGAIDQGLAYVRSLMPQSARPIQVFRAGGWALQPEQMVLEELADRGILMDSTVAPGSKNSAQGDWYDFTHTPNKPYWPISDNVCIEDSRARMIEVPIATHEIGYRARYSAIKQGRAFGGFPEGCHGSYDGPNDRWQQLRGKLSKIMTMKTVMLDFCTLPASSMVDITQRYMDRYRDVCEHVPIVAIGHNKNFNAWSENNLSCYLEWVARQPDCVFSDYQQWFSASGL